MNKFRNIIDSFDDGRLFFREIQKERGSSYEISKDGGLSWFPVFESIYKKFYKEFNLKANEQSRK